MKGRLLSTVQCGTGHNSQAATATGRDDSDRCRGDQTSLRAATACAALRASNGSRLSSRAPVRTRRARPLASSASLASVSSIGVDPVARRQLVEKSALGRDILQPHRNDQLLFQDRRRQFLGDVGGCGGIGGKQQHENLAVFQRLGGGDAPVLARAHMGVVPGFHAFGPQAGSCSSRAQACVRPPVTDEDFARHARLPAAGIGHFPNPGNGGTETYMGDPPRLPAYKDGGIRLVWGKGNEGRGRPVCRDRQPRHQSVAATGGHLSGPCQPAATMRYLRPLPVMKKPRCTGSASTCFSAGSR